MEDSEIQSAEQLLERVKLVTNQITCPEGCSHDNHKKKYQFWETQPVPKLNTDTVEEENGPIIIYEDINYKPKKSDKIFKTSIDFDKLHNIDSNGKLVSFKNIKHIPYPLPPGFEWSQIDIEKTEELQELYTLLNENYVEDEDNMFRFDYKPEFLLWALRPPGWKSEWLFGIRVTNPSLKVADNESNNLTTKGKLVSFISAIPAKIYIQGSVLQCVEINFLCVHKKLRSKRIAPVLISEITRRVNLHHIWYAVYTAGVVLPKACSVARYWHRSLNAKKLIEIKFSHLTRNMTLSRAQKLYKLPNDVSTPGLRPLKVSKNNKNDIIKGCKLLNSYLSSSPHQLYPVFDERDFEHWFAPRSGVIETFVVENVKTGELTDMFSFYSLPSSVINHPIHKTLQAAYSFYIVSNSTPLVKLMTDALISAKLKGYDVYNALDLMENQKYFEELKFGIGDGCLQYYLFNWRCKYMKPEEVALVLQ